MSATAVYAKGTQVSTEKSKTEIERTLTRYGASAFGYYTDSEKAVVEFMAHDRAIRFVLPMPSLEDFKYGPGYRSRTATQQKNFYDQAVKERWRALALAVKAKLEAVNTGITTFDQEFAVHMVLPNGSTVGDWLLPQIEHAVETNEMPGNLLGLPAPPDPMLQIEAGIIEEEDDE